jgi:hypothetical protein
MASVVGRVGRRQALGQASRARARQRRRATARPERVALVGGGSSGGADDDDGGDDDTQKWLDSVAEEAGEADSLLAG